MTYPDAIQFLYHLSWFGVKFGLENTLSLAALAGNPQRRLRFIHVAGTNGKGSTCAMLEAMCRAAGLRVGLFTSPHLVNFGERIQVNREIISEADVARLVAGIQPLLAKGWPGSDDASPKAGGHPTFFEVVTVLALQYFAERQCDLVVWETGLGGRLDATNIVTPVASVITNVQFDHQQWLGDTLTSIAVEKAGIIKPGVPVITACEEREALDVITRVARERAAPLTVVAEVDGDRAPLDTIKLSLDGRHQRLNAALAVATLRQLAGSVPVDEMAMRAGLTEVEWPGRLQLITRASGQKVLLDGAHNVAGAEALAAALERRITSSRPTMILGILQDKNWAGFCHVLAPLAGRILLTPVSSERTALPADLCAACAEANPSVRMEICDSPAAALRRAEGDPFLLVTGSLYLVGEVLELIRSTSGEPGGERRLNEWNASR